MLNKTYVKKFCESFNYPEQATKALIKAADFVEDNDSLSRMFEQSISDYNTDKVPDPTEHYEEMTAYAKTLTDFPYESIDLLFYILLAEHLEEVYEKAGLSHDLWRNAMDDLRCKLFECYNCKGIWGTFAGGWFPDFYYLKRLALGRIQYQPAYVAEDIKTLDGRYELKAGELFIDMHIPSSGPLKIEEVKASLRMAVEYFGNMFQDKDYVFFGCDSWLLFEKHREWLPEKSGIVQFMNLFSFVRLDAVTHSNDLWRVFNTFETSSKCYDRLPEDTLLRRKYKEYLLSGGKQGSAFGIIKMKK
ncbi:MAG: acyltransferase domain-containing protein [Clostridia bacterium]|nr:acyltransferase domain-containing protein [Clostridia bacterium]